ncbi:MAG: family 16 glycoside hydrolase, partial [Tannerellaceae bacterium]
CKGKLITVRLNGRDVTKMDMNIWKSGTKNPDGTEIPSWLPKPFAELPTKGYIGLQGKHGDSQIWFRNVTIKEL